MINKLAFCSLGYVRETVDTAISSPSKAPKIAPDQGLAVTPQVLPTHLLKYPIAPPTTAPATTAMTYLIIVGIDSFTSSYLYTAAFWGFVLPGSGA